MMQSSLSQPIATDIHVAEALLKMPYQFQSATGSEGLSDPGRFLAAGDGRSQIQDSHRALPIFHEFFIRIIEAGQRTAPFARTLTAMTWRGCWLLLHGLSTGVSFEHGKADYPVVSDGFKFLLEGNMYKMIVTGGAGHLKRTCACLQVRKYAF